jgi:ribosomal protein L40E
LEPVITFFAKLFLKWFEGLDLITMLIIGIPIIALLLFLVFKEARKYPKSIKDKACFACKATNPITAAFCANCGKAFLLDGNGFSEDGKNDIEIESV